MLIEDITSISIENINKKVPNRTFIKQNGYINMCALASIRKVVTAVNTFKYLL